MLKKSEKRVIFSPFDELHRAKNCVRSYICVVVKKMYGNLHGNTKLV